MAGGVNIEECYASTTRFGNPGTVPAGTSTALQLARKDADRFLHFLQAQEVARPEKHRAPAPITPNKPTNLCGKVK